MMKKVYANLNLGGSIRLSKQSFFRGSTRNVFNFVPERRTGAPGGAAHAPHLG